MIDVRTRALMIVAAAGLLLVPAGARADYMSANVLLHSSLAGPNVGNVLAEANNGSSTVNGLMYGQVRLTYSVNPVAAYGDIAANFGFQQVGFTTDLPLSVDQVTVPDGYSLNLPSSPMWAYVTTADVQKPKVSVLFNGLGNQATLDHFLHTTVVGANRPPPLSFIFIASVDGFQSGNVLSDNVIGDTVHTTPEPSALVIGILVLAGAVVARLCVTVVQRTSISIGNT